MTNAPQLTGTRIPVNGGQLWGETAGRGDDLLLVHSGITDRRMWDDQLAALADRFRIVRYDMRGFGNSTPVSDPYSHVDDLFAVCDQYGLEDAVVVAASMGARVAIDAALREPRRFNRLLLVGPAVGGLGFDDPALRRCWAEMTTLWEAGQIEEAIDLETRFWINGPGRTGGGAGEAIIARVIEMQRQIVELLPDDEDDPEVAEEIAAVDRLNQLTAPLLVVVGEHDVGDIHRNARVIEEKADNARIVTLPDTGHLPNMEAIEAFNRLALEFLRA